MFAYDQVSLTLITLYCIFRANSGSFPPHSSGERRRSPMSPGGYRRRRELSPNYRYRNFECCFIQIKSSSLFIFLFLGTTVHLSIEEELQ